MKKLTKSLAILLSVLLLMITIMPRSTSAAMVDDGRDILLMINGKYVGYANPVYKDGRILIPLRAISNELGATTQFKNAKQPIVIKLGKNTLQFTLGKKQASINGKTVKLDVPAQSINNTTYVPVRLVADGLGVGVEVNEPTKTVAIESKQEAGQTKLTVQSAKAIVQKELDRSTKLSTLGTMYLHYYQFQAYNEHYEYDFYYLVDKYTGELYTWQLDRSMENLSRKHAFEKTESKFEGVGQKLQFMPSLYDYDTEQKIKGKNYYGFIICYTAAQGPNYITELYVSTNGETSYMLDSNGKIIAFSEASFKKVFQSAEKIKEPFDRLF